MKNETQKDHAEYSASGSSRWLNCPASHELSKRYPPLPESRYSVEGTLAHECLEFLLKNRGNLAAAAKMAAKKYNAEMIEHGIDAVQYILKRQAELPGSEIVCEQRIDTSPFLGPGQFGTGDVAIIQEYGKLLFLDYKYGAGIPVFPREHDGQLNSQLVCYALGVSYAYDHNFASVELGVIQPRAWVENEETIRTVEVEMHELLAWDEILKTGVKATKSPNPVMRAGKWCKFCAAAIDCPEIKDKALKNAQIVFSDTKTVGVPIEVSTPAEVRKIPNLGRVLDACDKLEEWIKKVRAHAMDVLNAGGEVEGYKLVEKRGVRRWLDKDLAMSEAVKYWGKDACEEPKLKSPAQFEKTFPGKDAKAWVAERTTSISSGLTLVEESDKRPAILGAAYVFDVIE